MSSPSSFTWPEKSEKFLSISLTNRRCRFWSLKHTLHKLLAGRKKPFEKKKLSFFPGAHRKKKRVLLCRLEERKARALNSACCKTFTIFNVKCTNTRLKVWLKINVISTIDSDSVQTNDTLHSYFYSALESSSAGWTRKRESRRKAPRRARLIRHFLLKKNKSSRDSVVLCGWHTYN